MKTITIKAKDLHSVLFDGGHIGKQYYYQLNFYFQKNASDLLLIEDGNIFKNGKINFLFKDKKGVQICESYESNDLITVVVNFDIEKLGN